MNPEQLAALLNAILGGQQASAQQVPANFNRAGGITIGRLSNDGSARVRQAQVQRQAVPGFVNPGIPALPIPAAPAAVPARKKKAVTTSNPAPVMKQGQAGVAQGKAETNITNTPTLGNQWIDASTQNNATTGDNVSAAPVLPGEVPDPTNVKLPGDIPIARTKPLGDMLAPIAPLTEAVGSLATPLGLAGGLLGAIGQLGQEEQFNRRRTLEKKLNDFAGDSPVEYRQAIEDPLKGGFFGGLQGQARAGSMALLQSGANQEARQRAVGQVFAGAGERRMEAAAEHWNDTTSRNAMAAEEAQTRAANSMMSTAQGETNMEWDQWQKDYEAGRLGSQNRGVNLFNKVAGGALAGIGQMMDFGANIAGPEAKRRALNESLKSADAATDVPQETSPISNPTTFGTTRTASSTVPLPIDVASIQPKGTLLQLLPELLGKRSPQNMPATTPMPASAAPEVNPYDEQGPFTPLVEANRRLGLGASDPVEGYRRQKEGDPILKALGLKNQQVDWLTKMLNTYRSMR